VVEEQLDDLDHELLGHRNNELLVSQASQRSPKRPHSVLYNIEHALDDPDDEDIEQSPSKKQQQNIKKADSTNSVDFDSQDPENQGVSNKTRNVVTSSRNKPRTVKALKLQKRREPRRLPIDELIIFTDRMEFSDQEKSDGK